MSWKLPQGVTSTDWERVRRRLIANATHCALCGRPLVPDAQRWSPWSTEVDHIISREAFKHLPPAQQREYFLSPTNLQVAHKTCNVKKGDGRTQQQQELVTASTSGVSGTSRDW